MELRHIRYFLTVAEESSITRAAAKLNIAQPPLSRQIQNLEAELGVKLFSRDSHRLRLTEEGVLFRQYAIQIQNLAERSVEDIRERKKGLRGTIYISLVEGRAPQLLSRWIAGFQKLYPLVEYILWNGNSDEIENRVMKGLADLAIIVEPYNPEGMEALRVHAEPWVALLPPRHPLALLPGDSLSMEQLAPYELIIPARPSRLPEITGWFAGTGQVPQVRCRISHTLDAIELTRQGVGIALYPAAARDCAGDFVCIKYLKNPSPMASYVLIRSRERTPTRVAEEFFNYVKACMNQEQNLPPASTKN